MFETKYCINYKLPTLFSATSFTNHSVYTRCKYNTLDTTLPCIHHTDCYSCSSNSCYWTSANTCSSNKSLRTTCNGACKDWSTCTECHGNAQCAWYKDTCTHTSNVVRSDGKRSCPVVCGDIDDCTRYSINNQFNLQSNVLSKSTINFITSDLKIYYMVSIVQRRPIKLLYFLLLTW